MNETKSNDGIPVPEYRLAWERQESDLDRMETWTYIQAIIGMAALMAAMIGIAVLMFGGTR